ncbi:MAG: hypothetical protein K2H85_08860 [Allobaculum sp.]|nr:hypothetical protein [Allobaculum sp.]
MKNPPFICVHCNKKQGIPAVSFWKDPCFLKVLPFDLFKKSKVKKLVCPFAMKKARKTVKKALSKLSFQKERGFLGRALKKTAKKLSCFK